MWGAFYPALLYLLVTELMGIIFLAIAIYHGKIVISNSSDVVKFVSQYALLMTFFATLVTAPVLILIKCRDLKQQRAIGAYGYKSESFFKYLLIIPFSIVFVYTGNVLVHIFETLIPSMADSFENTAKSIYGANIYLQIITVVILGPIVEELVFRGLMYIRLKRMFGIGISSLVTGLAFGIFHGNISQGIYAFLFSYAAIFLYEKYKNIYAPIIFHMTANAFSVLVTFLLKDYNTSSESVTTTSSNLADLGVMIFIFCFGASICSLFVLLIYRYVNPRKK